MNLILDQGNSFTKLALFKGGQLVSKQVCPDDQISDRLTQALKSNSIEGILFSSVRKSDHAVTTILAASGIRWKTFDDELVLPIGVDYTGEQVAGADRLANCVAANKLYNGQNCLVVDFGTCTTYSVLKDGAFVGGAISPGIHMRFGALHHFTGKLPLVAPVEDPSLLGHSTNASIQSGVQVSALLETDAMIGAFCSEYALSNVLLTGGDMPYFEARLKSRTFAHPDLTVTGLNEILEFNA